MTRIGVLGANGQVGAEVCLLLLAQGFDVVPISRNPTGSAFLRSRGVRCRHGRTTDADEARGLMSDCDVILNFARPVSGRPADARRANQALIANMVDCSAPNARLLYFSSLCAYPKFRPMNEPAVFTAYGWEKRWVEKLVRREASRRGKEAWNLRLGNVAGELQTITAELRGLIRSGPVVVPWEGEYPSNMVYTATIVEAVLAIASGQEPPGTYDLVCPPTWTWRRALAYEAACIGVPLRMEEPVPALQAHGAGGWSPGSWARGLVSRVLNTTRSRELGLIALNFLSAETNLRAQSAHFQRRARSELDRYFQRSPAAPSLLLAQAGSRFLHSLRPTEELLEDPKYRLPDTRAIGTFVPDLPRAI